MQKALIYEAIFIVNRGGDSGEADRHSELIVRLDALARNLALPAPDASQNQIESNTAIEDAELGCDSIGR